ncbi:glycosyltransferase family 4 protein [Mastigocoleus testarum]|uniref:Glycosyl transferase family 1 n=1 Tax=Mastigocoleus testarum BC008 TaxID=371196 RepID=A0A0V7ZHC1_9CYAN|nr:glycosyltransferase family 4 protein [Mastigocoleus testarum]KST63638.1 glycosyl transferase family 1 [Mastigocoleus testarum BC008]
MSVINIWHVGGEDIHMRIPLLLKLREKGFQVGAVGSASGNAFVGHNIPYFSYTLERGIGPWSDIRSCKQLFDLFTRYKPDIVHGFDTKPAIAVPLVARKAGIPGRVCTITGMGYIFSSNSPLALALRPVYNYLQGQASTAAGITVFQNRDDRQYFYTHKMVQEGYEDLVLGSGVEVEQLTQNYSTPEEITKIRRELNIEENQLVVTMISRLVVSKGVREYLQAASIVCREMKNVTFLLIGPLSSEGRQAVSIKEIERQAGVVKYLGPRSDIPTLLNLTDIFVLPSYYREGVPRVLLEAGAMKLPLVATDMPGCNEAVKHGWNGLLVPPKDAQALSGSIMQLLRSKNTRTLMGARSELHVREKFSLKHVADRYTEIYYRVLQQAA